MGLFFSRRERTRWGLTWPAINLISRGHWLSQASVPCLVPGLFQRDSHLAPSKGRETRLGRKPAPSLYQQPTAQSKGAVDAHSRYWRRRKSKVNPFPSSSNIW